MKLVQKVLCCLVFTFLLASSMTVCFAENTTTTINTYSAACLLMDANTGKILYEKNSNEKMFPASTTKIMTAILTLEHCQLTDTATVSRDAVFTVPSGYSIANLQVDEVLTIDQLLHVLLIPSANDAANVLAEHIGGSVQNFSSMMNAKAVELGCKNTHFVNANGVHNENHYSTAYDLALIGKYAMQNSVFRSIVSMTNYTLPATNKYDTANRMFNTTNELLKVDHRNRADNYYYSYATGAKTGYTDPAKNCIVATAQKDDLSLITVILGGERTPDGLNARALDCICLFDYGFDNYSYEKIKEQNAILQQISISGATKDTRNLDVLVATDINLLIKKGTNLDDISPTIQINSDLKAPIAKGTIIGKINYSVDGIEYSSNLIASNNVYKSDIIKIIFQILLAVFILLFISSILNRKKKTKEKSSTKKKSSHRTYHPNRH